MNKANGVIEVFATQRKTGVTRLNGLFYIGLEIILAVQVDNLTARRHDIAHQTVAEVEHVEDKLTAQRSDVRRFFALLENEPQFLLAMRKLARAYRLKPKQSAQKEVGRFIQHPDRRFK